MNSVCESRTNMEATQLDDSFNSVQSVIFEILDGIEFDLKMINKSKIFLGVYDVIREDLKAFSQKDPACGEDRNYILNSYLSFRAVMSYRISNYIYGMKEIDKKQRYIIARCISEKCKLKTGIEIHPGANIGRRFVVDHGVGTVIGETAKIGDDCYMLQNVILGSNGIASNNPQKRHPTIGNNVEIGAFVRIFGAVNIGDNVVISPYAVVTSDIPRNSKVLIVNQLQLIKNNMTKFKPLISNVSLESENTLILNAKNLVEPKFSILDEKMENFKCVQLKINTIEENTVRIEMNPVNMQQRAPNNQFSLKVVNKDGSNAILLNSVELKFAIDNLSENIVKACN